MHHMARNAVGVHELDTSGTPVCWHLARVSSKFGGPAVQLALSHDMVADFVVAGFPGANTLVATGRHRQPSWWPTSSRPVTCSPKRAGLDQTESDTTLLGATATHEANGSPNPGR